MDENSVSWNRYRRWLCRLGQLQRSAAVGGVGSGTSSGRAGYLRVTVAWSK